jgi:hypothetical protein
VKFGLSIGELVVSSISELDSKRKEEDDDVLQKSIRISNLSFIFEFYDNFFIISQMVPNNVLMVAKLRRRAR